MNNYSVLMSVYRKENPDYFRESMESILNQTVKTNDFVIVCDGELTPQLYATLEQTKSKFPDKIQVIQLKKNVGLGKALNEGLRHCRNELVARMDSDDISAYDRIEKQLRVFEEKNVDIVSGTVLEFSDRNDIALGYGEKRVLPQTQEQIIRFSKRRSPFNHAAAMFKKSIVEKNGGYQDCQWFEDYYLWMRMLAGGAKGYNISDVIYYVRSGDEMYQRRGGIPYLKQMVRFRTLLLKENYITWGDYLISVIGQSIVIMAPLKFRKVIYAKFLRKTDDLTVNKNL